MRLFFKLFLILFICLILFAHAAPAKESTNRKLKSHMSLKGLNQLRLSQSGSQNQITLTRDARDTFKVVNSGNRLKRAFFHDHDDFNDFDDFEEFFD
jgi:hypothetical protein